MNDFLVHSFVSRHDSLERAQDILSRQSSVPYVIHIVPLLVVSTPFSCCRLYRTSEVHSIQTNPPGKKMKRCPPSSLLLLVSLVSSFQGVYGASAFTNDGELRVAFESWASNDTAQVISKYGTIDTWNVSLITDLKGISCGRDACIDSFLFACSFGLLDLQYAMAHSIVFASFPSFQASSRTILPSMRISAIGTQEVSQTWIVFSCKNICCLSVAVLRVGKAGTLLL
jgi:hypothetical protein